MKRIVSVIGLCLVLLNCDVMDKYTHMKSLEVSAWAPDSEVLPDLTGAVIYIQFSEEVHQVKTEEAFSLKKEGTEQEGYFTWSSRRRMTFHPFQPLENNRVYTMELNTTAEDIYGNNLKDNFLFSFSTKTEWERPAVTGYLPLKDSIIDDIYQPVVISFSESMNTNSFFAGFDLSPSVSGAYTWNPERTQFTFTPQAPLNYQTRYTVTVSEDICDDQYNLLPFDTEFSFFVGSDSENPVLLSAGTEDNSYILNSDDPDDILVTLNSGWEKTDGILLVFSEEILSSTVKNALDIQPDIDYDLEFPDPESVLIKPDDNWIIDETYDLTISTGITDLMDNPVEAETQYHFIVDGPRSCYPEPLVLTLLTDPADTNSIKVLYADPALTVDPGDMAAFPLDMSEYNSSADGFMDIYFHIADVNEPMDFYSLINSAISITVTNLSASIVINSIEINPAAPAPMIIGTLPSDICIVRIDLTIDNDETKSGYINIKLYDSIKDTLDNPLKKDYQWEFYKNL